jgi:phosphoglycerate dehydrogenase-like enzyme
VKIAFRHSGSLLLNDLSRALGKRLAKHTFLDWAVGDAAPADDIELLLVMGQLTRDDLERQQRLFFVQTTSAGYEGIDIDAATELGIWVSFAPSGETGNAISVAEWAILLMIGASRRLKAVLASLGDPSAEPERISVALSGKTACIVGLGAIGRNLVERLLPFGMTLVATDEHPETAPDHVRAYPTTQLRAAVTHADYVVVCAPASKENEHLIDASVLAAMKRGAILVNVSRGSLVDETALIAALDRGQIAAVGLDVVTHEPIEKSEPLLRFPQALVTPHVAGGTDLMIAGTIAHIEAVVKGLDAGKKPQSTLNTPPHPRRALA